jgi:IclR family KDG regulon transcriptional repressor
MSSVVAHRATNLRRGLEILLALGEEEAVAGDGLGVTRIARLTGAEKSQVSRACAALADLGLIDRNAETRRYRLGWRLFTLAARAGDRGLLDAAPAALDGLVRELSETAHLTVRQHRQALTLLSQSPPSSVAATGWTGRTVPLTCTSSGRALLFDNELPALQALLSDDDFGHSGPNGPRDVGELFGRIEAARARGWAIADEEFEVGLVGAASPIRDFTGRIVAAVNISGPKFRLGSQLREGGREVRRVADSLSVALGAPHVPPGGRGALRNAA